MMLLSQILNKSPRTWWIQQVFTELCRILHLRSSCSVVGRKCREPQQWCFCLVLQLFCIYSPSLTFSIFLPPAAALSSLCVTLCSGSEIKTSWSIRGTWPSPDPNISCAEMNIDSEACTVTQKSIREHSYPLHNSFWSTENGIFFYCYVHTHGNTGRSEDHRSSKTEAIISTTVPTSPYLSHLIDLPGNRNLKKMFAVRKS